MNWWRIRHTPGLWLWKAENAILFFIYFWKQPKYWWWHWHDYSQRPIGNIVRWINGKIFF